MFIHYIIWQLIEKLRNLRIEETQNLTKCLKLNKLFTTFRVVSATLAHFRHFKLQTYYGQLYLEEKVLKLSIFIIIAIMGVIVLVRKRIAGAVANNKNLRDAPIGNVTRSLTDITAKGIDWLNEQWGQSKEK